MRKPITTDDKGGGTVVKTPNAPVSDLPTIIPVTPTGAVYRWQIPSTNGYVLVLEVADAQDESHARQTALSMDIPIEGEGEEEVSSRGLTAMECAWVKSTEPEIVVDTSAITVNHYRALQEIAELKRENAQYAIAKEVYKGLGIDPDDPQSWVTAQSDRQKQVAMAASSALDARAERLSSLLTTAMNALAAAREETGFAPPKPVAPTEPDYSILTILADETYKNRFPRLTAANWVDRNPELPMTDEEMHAWNLLTHPDYGVISQWRMGAWASQDDVDKMEALVKRLRALTE